MGMINLGQRPEQDDSGLDILRQLDQRLLAQQTQIQQLQQRVHKLEKLITSSSCPSAISAIDYQPMYDSVKEDH